MQDACKRALTKLGRYAGKGRLGDILVRRGVLSEVDLARALELQEKQGGRLGELLVREGYVEERALLNALAEESGLTLITADQVATTPVPPEAIEAVPIEVAQELSICPVWADPLNSELVVVTGTVDRGPLEQRLRESTDFATVTLLLSQPSTVQAAIARAYLGVEDAFDRIDLDVDKDSEGTGTLTVELSALVEELHEAEAPRIQRPRKSIWSKLFKRA